MKKIFNTKQCFTELAESNKAENFFNNNYSEIRYTVIGYKFLKEIYDREGDLSNDRYFKLIFGQFYAMGALFVTKNFIEDFYDKMDAIRNRKRTANLDPTKIALELCNEETGFQFSFVTKMLNLENDTLYPIYDSMVALMFNFNLNELVGKNHSEKASIYNKWYKEIITTYNDLLKDEQRNKKNEQILKEKSTKGQKIYKLMKNGFSRKDVLEMKIADPAYVYDTYRFERQRLEKEKAERNK